MANNNDKISGKATLALILILVFVLLGFFGYLALQNPSPEQEHVVKKIEHESLK